VSPVDGVTDWDGCWLDYMIRDLQLLRDCAVVIIENCCPGLAFVCGIALAASAIGIYAEMHPQPTPMDVHQGKTTVEYKYIDGIKTDSTIVFKPDLFVLE